MSDPKGIDPELVPYLLGEDEAKLEREEAEGPDPELVAQLLGEPGTDDEFGADGEPAADGEAATNGVPELSAEERVKIRAAVRQLSEALFARAPEHDIDPSLKRIAQLLDILGNPENAYPVLHIAGTNGKTSTARIADALLGAFDLKVGRFTSPHLIDVRERISLEGEPISPERFLDAWNDIAPYVQMVDDQGSPKLSFFEVLTAMAYAAFADYPVDVAVIETGMGGTWDATNPVNSGVQVITHISRDHEKWLGTDLVSIAGEKAGIIKDRSIVVVQRQDPAVMDVIRARISETDSVARIEGEDWEVLSRQPGVGGQLMTVRTPAATYEDLFVPLLGEHQASNAAAALVAVEAMMGGKALKADLVDAGLQSAKSPGRMEVLRTSPTIVVDSAHNQDGAAALRRGLEEAFDFEYAIGVYSSMADKNIEAVLAEMEPGLDGIVVVPMNSDRAADTDALFEIAQDVFDDAYLESDLVRGIDKATELIDKARDLEATKGVVVFGSVVLAGEASALLRPDRRIL